MANLNENTFKKVFEGKFRKTPNGYSVCYDTITVGDNNTGLGRGKILSLKNSIITKGQLEPVKVRLTEIDGQVKLLLVSGYTRMQAFKELIEEGCFNGWIEISLIYEGGDFEDVVLNYKDNCRNQYTDLERGCAIHRLYELKKEEGLSDDLIWGSISIALSETVERCKYYMGLFTKQQEEIAIWIEDFLATYSS